MLTENRSRYFLPWMEGDPPPVWSDLFGNNKLLALEIGCGVGDFLVEMALLHPELNFIALDFYNRGCIKTCKRLEKSGLDNAIVLRAEARSFIKACIAPASLDMVIINCPDPWPKLRHRKRRLVNPDFATFMSGYMRPGADLCFATDFVDYGVDVAGFMAIQPGFINQLAPDSFRHTLPGYPVSKYMRRFLDLGQQIYYVHYKKG